jgi:hypothetical protein
MQQIIYLILFYLILLNLQRKFLFLVQCSSADVLVGRIKVKILFSELGRTALCRLTS